MNDEDLLKMIHDIALDMQEIKDKFSFLEEKVETLTEAIKSLKDRIKDLEVYVTKKNALTNFFSYWYKIPVLAAIIAGIIELIKNKLHF